MADKKPIEATDEAHRSRILAALDSGVEQIYFNGFVNVLGTGDVIIVLER